MKLKKALHTTLGARETFVLWKETEVVAALDLLNNGAWAVWKGGKTVGVFAHAGAAIEAATKE